MRILGCYGPSPLISRNKKSTTKQKLSTSMFDTNFNRLKEFLSQEGDGNKSDLSFMGVLRETFKKYSEHYRYCKKAIIDWNCDERLFSVVIDSMCVKKIQIAGRVTNLAVLDTLRSHHC